MSTSYTQHLYAGYSLLQVFYSIVFCNFCHHLVMYYISFEIFCQLLLTLFFHSSLRLASHYIRMVLSSYLHLELLCINCTFHNLYNIAKTILFTAFKSLFRLTFPFIILISDSFTHKMISIFLFFNTV